METIRFTNPITYMLHCAEISITLYELALVQKWNCLPHEFLHLTHRSRLIRPHGGVSELGEPQRLLKHIVYLSQEARKLRHIAAVPMHNNKVYLVGSTQCCYKLLQPRLPFRI